MSLKAENNQIRSTLSYACRFIPALVLAVILIISLFTVGYDINSKESNAEFIYLISMIIMLGVSVIVAILGKGIITRLIGAAIYLVYPFFCFFLLEYYIHDPFIADPVIMKEGIMTLNVFIFYALSITLTLITTRSDVAMAITSAVPMIFGFCNLLALSFRGTPIYPWDLNSTGTALSVLDNYVLEMTPRLYFIIFTFLFFIGIGFLASFRIKFKKVWINLSVAFVALALCLGYFSYLTTDEMEDKYKLYPYLFSATYLYKHNGTALSFINTTKYLKLSTPDGYSPSELEELYESYRQKAEDDAKDSVKPNVIVIMNEAFSDPAVLGDFTTNIDYLPYINSNSELIKGYTYVSVKGGNTPNTEFEFLTGTSMAFLPAGSIPYQQHIKSDTDSLVSHLDSLGYTTVGMHPYGASGWERDEVYKFLGFDQTLFSPDFKGGEKIRNYYSDRAMYRKIIDIYENKNENDPLFVFGVTMQNHSSYDKKYDNFTPDVYASRINSRRLSTYLSLMKKSDEAFGELVEYFRDADEPTVILMFGDHQPNDNVIQQIYKLNQKNINSLTFEEEQNRFLTPYVLWSNYEIDKERTIPEVTSVNYLSALLCDYADIAMSPFQYYLLDLMDEVPIINANCYVKDSVFYSADKASSEDSLAQYSRIQYNLVFDRKNLNKNFFMPAGYK